VVISCECGIERGSFYLSLTFRLGRNVVEVPNDSLWNAMQIIDTEVARSAHQIVVKVR
jgi:hypothetical protein